MRLAPVPLTPVLLSALLLTVPSLSGQEIKRVSPASEIPLSIDACPISVSAQHQADGGLLDAHRAAPQGASQSLRVTLENHSLRDIVALDLEVQGTSPRGRVTPIPGNTAGEVVRRIHLSRDLRSSGTADSDLTVESLTSVSRIALVSVTFRDGSYWKASSTGQCATVPNPLMPVAQLH